MPLSVEAAVLMLVRGWRYRISIAVSEPEAAVALFSANFSDLNRRTGINLDKIYSAAGLFDVNHLWIRWWRHRNNYWFVVTLEITSP